MARVVKTDTQAASKRMLSTKRSLRLRATLDRANCASLASPVSGGFDMVRSGVVEVAVIAGPFLAFGLLNINGFFKWITLSVPLCIYALAITLGFGWLFDRDSVLSLFGRIKFMFQRGK